MEKHRATYRGHGPYKAVVKNAGGEIVAECTHWHRNRDTSSQFSGQAARPCASQLLQQVDPASFEASLPAWMRSAS